MVSGCPGSETWMRQGELPQCGRTVTETDQLDPAGTSFADSASRRGRPPPLPSG